MSRRLYLGKLPADTRSEDVSKFFDGYGKIIDCRVMTGFGFVEFENARDAEDALHHFNGKNFMGQNIVVEFAKESRPRREPYEDRYGAPTRARRPPGIRIVVLGISRDTSWQLSAHNKVLWSSTPALVPWMDLKDFGREAGNVSFADIDRDTPGQGILEYLNREDAERAVKELDGRDLRGQAVRVELFEDVSTSLSTEWSHTLNALGSATLIITAGMIAVNIVMTATRMNVIKKSVTAMIAMTGTVKRRRPSVVIGRVLLPVVVKTIVAPGHLQAGGIMKIEGLQGTMIDGEAMMTGEVLTLIMIVAGTTAGKTAVAMKRRNGSKTGLPGTMGTAGGVEGGCRVVMVRGPSKMKGTERATDPPDG
ncbi:hypothetical protein BC827DRAFT_1152949 [Russula dissimulans]|nr:hypothetical protein BC827DRAFT_1152949 [Russula dissimulans]